MFPLYSPQSRQSAKLFLQSSEFWLPQPLTRRRVCPPRPPRSDEGTYTVVLIIYTYFVVFSVWWSDILF
jgi:hypothetical protein